MANNPAESRDVRGNDINPETIGGRSPPSMIDAIDIFGTCGEFTDGVKFVRQDLTSVAGEQDELAIHDGTGTADVGLYRHDGTDWVYTEGTGVI